MQIGILKEDGDARVALVPDVVKQLVQEKNTVVVETGAGQSAFYSDKDYTDAGATVAPKNEVLSSADMLITIFPLSADETSKVKKSALLVSSFQPFLDVKNLDVVKDAGISAISLDMIPRITLAQSMDILSSMASIAGYKAVIVAAAKLPRYFPMLTTAAGSIPPAKVLILGAGVAGLQAIATAKRLGAVVEAFDTRAAAKEEVQSLGAKFVEVEGAKDDKAAGGYAVEQTEEFKQRQRALIKDRVEKSDVVISTAQVRGRKAPLLITKDMVEVMKPGSVIVDLASSTGGNCELTEDNKTIVHQQVTIIGSSELASDVSMHASQLFSKNIHNLLKVMLKNGELTLDTANPIIQSALVVQNGEVRMK